MVNLKCLCFKILIVCVSFFGSWPISVDVFGHHAVFLGQCCRFWAHIVMEYACTFWACYLLYKEYATVAAMRLQFMASERRRPDQFSVRL